MKSLSYRATSISSKRVRPMGTATCVDSLGGYRMRRSSSPTPCASFRVSVCGQGISQLYRARARDRFSALCSRDLIGELVRFSLPECPVSTPRILFPLPNLGAFRYPSERPNQQVRKNSDRSVPMSEAVTANHDGMSQARTCPAARNSASRRSTCASFLDEQVVRDTASLLRAQPAISHRLLHTSTLPVRPRRKQDWRGLRRRLPRDIAHLGE